MFPPQNRFHKIFNRYTAKIGYSCMPNVKTPINSHNHKTPNLKNITKGGICNYIDTAKCLLSQNCLINKIICSISTNQPILQRKNLIWQSWNSNQAVTLKPANTIYIFKVQNRHWIMQWSIANEKIQTKTIYHLRNSTKMFFLQSELKKNTTYVWMKNWKLSLTK